MKHTFKMLLFSLTLIFGITNNVVAMETKKVEEKQSESTDKETTSCSLCCKPFSKVNRTHICNNNTCSKESLLCKQCALDHLAKSTTYQQDLPIIPGLASQTTETKNLTCPFCREEISPEKIYEIMKNNYDKISKMGFYEQLGIGENFFNLVVQHDKKDLFSEFLESNLIIITRFLKKETIRKAIKWCMDKNYKKIIEKNLLLYIRRLCENGADVLTVKTSAEDQDLFQNVLEWGIKNNHKNAVLISFGMYLKRASKENQLKFIKKMRWWALRKGHFSIFKSLALRILRKIIGISIGIGLDIGIYIGLSKAFHTAYPIVCDNLNPYTIALLTSALPLIQKLPWLMKKLLSTRKHNIAIA